MLYYVISEIQIINLRYKERLTGVKNCLFIGTQEERDQSQISRIIQKQERGDNTLSSFFNSLFQPEKKVRFILLEKY